MTLTNEQKQESVQTLSQMVSLLGFTAQVSEKEGDQGQLVLSLESRESGRLIGRKGHYLQSMELLLNRIMRKRHEQFPWVEVDIDGYQRNKRPGRGAAAGEDAGRLKQVALDTAKEVKRWGQPKTLGPLSARDRRVVHVTLRDDPAIRTESESADSAGMKKVTIRLAGKGEAPPAAPEKQD